MIRITMTPDLEYASIHCARNEELFSRMTQGPPVSMLLDGFQPLEGSFLPLARSPAHLEPVFTSGILSLSLSLFFSSQERRREEPRSSSNVPVPTIESDFRGHSFVKLLPFPRAEFCRGFNAIEVEIILLRRRRDRAVPSGSIFNESRSSQSRLFVDRIENSRGGNCGN